jgi:acylaminoacyl-peptidase
MKSDSAMHCLLIARLPALLMACWVLACGGIEARADAPVRDHEIEPEDYFTLATIGSFDLSADGAKVALVESRWDQEADRRTSELWLVDRPTKSAARLTFDTFKQAAVSWSPDGRKLYFLSDQPSTGAKKSSAAGKQQVWQMAAEGGPAQQLTRAAEGVVGYRLSRDGRTLYYQTSAEELEKDWKKLREEFDQLQYGHGVNDYSQIWKLDLDSWRTEKIIDEKRVIHRFEVSPDESMVAMHTTPDGNLISNEGWSRIDLFELASKELTAATPEQWRDGHPSPYGWIEGLAFSGDSKRLAFSVSFDGYSPKLYVAAWDRGDLSLRELPMPGDVTLKGGSMTWRGSSGELCFLADDHARTRLYSINDAGLETAQGGDAGTTLTPGDVVIGHYRFSADGAHLVVYQHGLEDAGDLYAVAGGKLERLTRINPQVDRWKLPQISIVRWQAADGTPVEGILELPPDYRPGAEPEGDGPLPMVVELHGGPTAATRYQFRLWIYGRALMPARGMAVLSPNYRGSTGYGDKFLVDLIGRENDIEVGDILAGVDCMVERGIADPDRLAVMGWSNGGYLTNCLITTTDRFKAASSGAGVLDQVIQWGTEDTPGHVINYMQGLPWEAPQAYAKGSPMFKLGQVSTPTIIHVGEHDARVPPAHSRALYRALKHYLHVPTELIVYPGAGHGLTTYKHRLAKMKWDLAWLQKYLGVPEEAEAEEAEKEKLE